MNFRFSFRRVVASVRDFSSKVSETTNPASMWSTYNRLLIEKPVLTKSITSGVIAFVADVACQKVFPDDKKKDVDWKRTAKFTILNTLLIGPLLHFWYGFLVVKIPGTGSLSTVYRVAMDQLVFAPFCIIPAFFSCSMLLDGTPELIPAKLQADWATTMVANFSLWVPAQFVNFRLVPPQFQVLFANLVGLFWNVYLSAAVAKEIEPAGSSDDSDASPTATTSLKEGKPSDYSSTK